jgi:acetylornithine deacetylase
MPEQPQQDELDARVLAAVDPGAAVALLRRAVGVPSVTGDEGAFARLVAAELEAAGADEVHLDEAEPGRPIVWSIHRGTGGGRSLLLSGHLDTVHVDGWRERWAGTEREDPFGGAIVDGELWGRGSVDLKAGICASLEALHTLTRANVRLRGDIVTAWVCDEESGEEGMGRSIGMHAIADRIAAGVIPRTDFAIYTEPSRLAVYPAQMGFFVADIQITGRSAYFGRPELGADALKAAHRVLDALWRHSDDISSRAEHPLVGRAFLVVGTAAAGGYIAVPGEAKLSLIRKLLPGEDLAAAAAELEAIVQDAAAAPGIAVTVAFPAGRDHEVGGLPSETPSDGAAVQRLQAALRQVRPGAGALEGAPFWAEMSFLERVGIPCVYCAPGDISNAHTHEERVPVDEVVDGVRALALFTAHQCGVEPHDREGAMT